MIRNIIVKTRNFVFKTGGRLPLIGWLLIFFWQKLDYMKFEMYKKIIQTKAILSNKDNRLKEEIKIFFRGKKLYQPLLEPAFRDISFLRQSEDRFGVIRQNLSVEKGTLLDIGACLGYFCFKFEDEHFDCYALEEDPMLCYFMEELKKIQNKKFKVICRSIFEYRKDRDLSFDVILALSVFHNFLERKDLYDDLLGLLKRLKAKEMFFETYIPDSQKSSKYYKDFTPEEFVNLIIEHSCFKKAELIGQSETGRPIYKFTT